MEWPECCSRQCRKASPDDNKFTSPSIERWKNYVTQTEFMFQARFRLSGVNIGRTETFEKGLYLYQPMGKFHNYGWFKNFLQTNYITSLISVYRIFGCLLLDKKYMFSSPWSGYWCAYGRPVRNNIRRRCVLFSPCLSPQDRIIVLLSFSVISIPLPLSTARHATNKTTWKSFPSLTTPHDQCV